MDDEEVIKSLGANVFESEAFEEKYIQCLEKQLDKIKKDKDAGSSKAVNPDGNDDMEEGEIEDDNEEETSLSSGIISAETNLASSEDSATVTGTNENIDDSGVTGDGEAKSEDSVKAMLPQKSILAGLLTAGESAEDKRIRTGEMTPFGAVVEKTVLDPKATFLNFTAYLNSQKAFDQTRRKSKIDRKHNEASKSIPLKRKRPVTESFSHNQKKPKKAVAETVSRRAVLQDENSDYEGIPEEDSDYVPSDAESDGEWKPDSVEKKKVIRRTVEGTGRKTKNIYKEYDTDDSFSEEEVQKGSRCKKNPDDGDIKVYQNRLQEWKSKETRFTGNFHEIEGGFKLPKHIWDSLYDYQKVGVNWLWELHQKNCGGILGDEMGLGKTIQVIAFLAGLSSTNRLHRFTSFRGLGPTLLVCPATVMHQWVKEFHTWWPPFRVVILHETGSYSGSKGALIRSTVETNGVLVTSYAGIVNNLSDVLNHTWHYVILDEGHKIRNPDAQITLAVKQIPTSHRIILSGSPLQNNLKELWSLFDFVFPGKLGTLPVFIEQFSVPITQGGYSNASEIQVAAAYKCAKVLRDIIKPYLLRRMKSDVKHHVNLPPKTEQVLFCKLTEDQKACYINYLNSKEAESIVAGRINLFGGLIKLRKICNHPHLHDGGPKLLVNPNRKKRKSKKKKGTPESSYHSLNPFVSSSESSDSEIELDSDGDFGHWSKSGKMIVLETLLKLWHKQKHKVLLFTQSRQMLFILENFVRQQQYSYLKMDGTVSVGARQPMIKQFNENPDLFIFILTTKVGGLGVNLTGANRVVIFDPDWNPSTDLQARERAWRIGQERQVTIYRLITSGTIEEKIYHRQIFKQFLTNRVLKDPKQKRFFKNNDVMDLFSFNESSNKVSESEAIFAGTGSFMDRKAVKKSLKKSATEPSSSETIDPKEKSSGKFKGVPYLVKQRSTKTTDLSTDQETSGKQDDYVLRKLFRKSNVEAALKHDNLVDTNEPDYLLVEKEAERVAADAVKVLKKSREQCWAAETGRLTWTGAHGAVRQNEPEELPVPPAQPSPSKKLRFGRKSAPKPSTATTDENTDSSTFFSKVQSVAEGPITSAELIAAIRARKRELTSEEGGGAGNSADQPSSERPITNEDVEHVKSEYVEMLRDIREFIAFKAQVDGQATTDEILKEFAGKLPAKDSPVFKQMLSQLCTFRRVDGKGMWRLKPEFR